ncbi:MAG: Dihydroneopterin aldolase [Planctomycetes bacterium]|nr:Dihydroneopterin aldolase [Planctomycetota bacterium]
MSDRIEIHGLEVTCVVGVRDDERAAPRRLLVDVSLDVDLRDPGASDRLGDTVDYDALSRRIRDEVCASQHLLIERVAEDVARICRDSPLVRAVTVAVHKPGAVPGCGDVSVKITR